jgi:hypothetical protein
MFRVVSLISVGRVLALAVRASEHDPLGLNYLLQMSNAAKAVEMETRSAP